MGGDSTERLRARLEEALAHGQGEYSVEDILLAFARGEMQIWEFPEGSFAVTKMVHYPRKRRLCVILYSGEMSDERVEQFFALAKAAGADGIEAFGRPGWTRRLAKFGAKPAYTVMVKDWEIS